MKTYLLLAIISSLILIRFIFNSPGSIGNTLLFFSNYSQLAALIVGIATMLFIIYFINFLENELLVSFIFIVMTLLLIALATNYLGSEEYGSTRRIYLTNTFSIQPSELIKLPIILLSSIAFNKFYGIQIRLIPILLLIFSTTIILIQLQPDTSTALLFSIFFGLTIYFCGTSYRTLIAMLLGVIALLPLMLSLIVYEYQFARLSAFVNTNADPLGNAYIITLVKEAIGSSGMIGPGLINKSNSILLNVLAADSDFALAVIIEQLGFVFVIIIVIAFIAILWIGTSIALKSTNRFNYLSSLLATYFIVLQGILHVMVNLAIMPTTGTTLPFISNGSNSLVINLALIGIIIGVDRKNKITERNKTLNQ
jgi:rod shape determining protein RodA